MRSELISAELYAIAPVISDDSRRITVSCGEHLLTHNLKSGKLIHSSEALGAKPTRLSNRCNQLIISSESGSEAMDMKRGGSEEVSRIGDYQVMCVSDNVAVVSSVSSESGQVELGYIEGELREDAEIFPVVTGRVSVVACSKSLIAAVVDRRTLLVFDIAAKTKQEYLHNKALTAVAVHPLVGQVAVGDAGGRILRFSNNELKEYSFQHHWHACSVSSLVYASSGSVLLSGAEEGVLCIWNESSSDSKPQFIPRLGGPIAHMAVSKCSQYVAVCLRTNRIVVVDLFTRSIQASISGTLNDGDESETTKINEVTNSSVVALSTPTHAQLFDMDSRRPVNSAPISIQQRNHIPASLRAKLKAKPWECQHVSVLTADEKKDEWFLMASLSSRNQSSHEKEGYKKKNNQIVKFFVSCDSGSSWKLHSVCMNAHSDDVVGIKPLQDASAFVSASKDGSLKLWKLDQDSKIWRVNRSASFRNKTPPTFLNVSREGLVIAGFANYVTLWNPHSLTELSRNKIALSSHAVHADIIHGSTDLFALASDGTCSVWNLKSCRVVAETRLEDPSQKIVVACVVGPRMLVATASDVVSVTYREKSKKNLILEHISLGNHPIDQIAPIGLDSVVVGSNKGRSIHRIALGEASSSSTAFRNPEEPHAEEEVETEADSPQVNNLSTQPARKPRIQMNSLVSKLFPLEQPLDALGSPEMQFESLIAALSTH